MERGGGKPRANVEGKEWSEGQLRDYVVKKLEEKGYTCTCKVESASFVEVAKKGDKTTLYIGKALTPELAIKEVGRMNEFPTNPCGYSWGHFSLGIPKNEFASPFRTGLLNDIKSALN